MVCERNSKSDAEKEDDDTPMSRVRYTALRGKKQNHTQSEISAACKQPRNLHCLLTLLVLTTHLVSVQAERLLFRFCDVIAVQVVPVPDVQSAVGDHRMSPGWAPASLGNVELADDVEGTGAGPNKCDRSFMIKGI